MASSKIRRLLFYLVKPTRIINRHRYMMLMRESPQLSDEEFLTKCFAIRNGYSLNLNNPKGINEKMQWLKLFYRKDSQTVKVDKIKVRNYIKDTIGEEFLIPIIGVWNSPDEIDFNSLPNSFVLKCNHNSGKGLFICKDKSLLSESDINSVKKVLAEALKEDYYSFGREWPYKNVERKILAEEYIHDKNGELPDYKFWIINGKFEILMICKNRQKNLKMNFYDNNLKLLKCRRIYPNFKTDFVFPSNINEMINLAEKIAADDPFARVDLYNVDGKIYFGEITYFPGSGLEPFVPRKFDFYFGSMLRLPIKKEIK